MNQMDKETYLRILERKLHGISEEEKEDALNYVREYFEEAGEGNEQSVMNDLGSPSKFAATIKANTASKNMNQKSTSTKKPHSSMKTVITIFLGICAMPIALPLLFALCMLFFVFLLVVFVIGVVAVCGVVAFFVSGVPMLIKGFSLWNSPGNALISMGSGLITIGFSILLCLGAYQLLRTCIPFVGRKLTALYEQIKMKGTQKGNRKEREL